MKYEVRCCDRGLLGGVEQTKEMVRERRGLPILDVLLQDLRFGARMLRKNPGFTAVAVLTLALGIGVNTAIFTAFDALVLRPRPVKDPDSLAAVFRTTPGERHGRFSYPDYIYYRDHSKSFSEFTLFSFGMAITSSDLPTASPTTASRFAGAVGFQLPQLLQGSAQPIGCYFVSGNYFQMLGAVPLLGRIVLPSDDQLNAPPVVLMSGNFWQRQFHSDPKVVSVFRFANECGPGPRIHRRGRPARRPARHRIERRPVEEPLRFERANSGQDDSARRRGLQCRRRYAAGFSFS